MEFLKIGSAISTRNGRIYEISRNSTFPEIRARASGSGPTHQNLSADLDQEIRGNRLGYIHSGLEDFPDFQKLQLPGNPSPGFRSPDHFWDRFRITFWITSGIIFGSLPGSLLDRFRGRFLDHFRDRFQDHFLDHFWDRFWITFGVAFGSRSVPPWVPPLIPSGIQFWLVLDRLGEGIGCQTVVFKDFLAK